MIYKARSLGNIYRRKSSGNEEDTFFQFCCAGPNRFKAAKNAAHTPGSFSRPEFLNKGAEPQTVTQCASHTAAVSLVRECDVLHGVRANVGSDVPLEDACLVSGNLQVGAGVAPSRCVPQRGQRDSALCETAQLHVVSENLVASASVAETDRLHTVSENLVASASVAETDRLLTMSENLVEPDRLLAATESLASGDHSAWRSRVGGLRLRRQAHSRSGSFVENSSLSSHHVDHLHTRGVCCAHGEHDLHDARTNSCLGSHAARVNSPGLHSACDNSGGHVNSDGCTYNSCGGVRGGTKPKSTSTREQVGCPAVEKLASLQQAPGRLHVETWAGRNGNPSLSISQGVEILPGCADMVTCLPPPFFSSVSPGPGREVRNGMGWSLLEKTARSGVWLFRGALQGNSAFFAFSAFASWVRKGSFLTAWAVPPLSSCSCSYLYGRGTAIGPQTGKRCWPLLDRLWRAIAPLMKPWCAEGDVPSAANLNLYRGRSSHVGWHSDDEPLFGERGEAKLIVSVSFGTQALFKWKGKSCPSNDGRSCWLGHGDILVMDGQCQDEFYHCTDPGSDQERINITFRWVKQHVASCSFLRTGVACCLPTCARGFSFSDTGIVGIGIFWVFWLLLGTLCILGVLVFVVYPLVCTKFGFQRCALYWTRPVGGGRWGHYLCYPWGVCWEAQKTTSCKNYGIWGFFFF